MKRFYMGLLFCLCVLLTACRQPEPPECAHEFTSKVTVEATCAKEGVKTNACTLCGYIAGEEAIPALEHTFGEAVVTKEPTCIEKGEKSVFCTVCNFQQSAGTISPTGTHTFVSTNTRQPSCSLHGEQLEICSGCNFTIVCKDDCPICGKNNTEALSITPHVWKAGATCGDPATCTLCGISNPDGIGHNYVLERTNRPASNNFASTRYYRCADCDKGKVEYFGDYGTYDLDALKAFAEKYAAKYGFEISATNGKPSGPPFGPSYQLSALFKNLEPGYATETPPQKKLENMVMSAVDYLANSSNNPLKYYYLYIEVGYSSNGAIGYGQFYISLYMYFK